MTLPNIRPVQFNDASKTPCMSLESNYEDMTLIWLDEHVNDNYDCLDTQCCLRTIVNYLKIFDNVQETIGFVRSALNEHLFLIVSGSLGESVISCIHNESQLKFIYIFCMNIEQHSIWANKYEKVCGIFIDKYELFNNLTNKVQSYGRSLLTISVFNRIQTETEEKSTRDYMIEENIGLRWLESFIDILLRAPIDQNLAKQDMISECRLYYKNNATELKRIDEFEANYCADTAIHWYTRDSFVYRLVNKALRTLNIDIIFKFRFLIIDLYQQLKQRHVDYMKSLSTIDPRKRLRKVYRSQHMGINELEKLKLSVGNLIRPNTFFSTTEDFLMSQSFVAGSTSTELVLFQIDIPDSYYHKVTDTSKFTCSFFKLDNLSQFQGESEVIFSLGALFRIESIEEHNMWLVCLKFEAENDELGQEFDILEELVSGNHDWQSRGSVEDRILMLTEKFPQSTKNIINIYIKYGVFSDVDKSTSEETLNTYRKGFELLMKCFPGYCYIITIAMHLSIGQLYCNRGERILAMQFGQTALEVAETYLPFDHDCALVCYNYLAVIYRMEDQFTEALSIYEKMLSTANEHDNTSALLAIYSEISFITCDFGDYEYEMICLKKIMELKRKLNCENLTDTYNDFGSYYERQGNFRAAIYYYKQNFLYLLQHNGHMTPLTRVYCQLGEMYEKYNHYIAALQIYIRIIQVQLAPLLLYDRSLLRKYETVIKSIKRLIKCRCLKKLKRHFCSLMSRSFSSIIFVSFIQKLKFLFYFQFDQPKLLKESLSILLMQVIKQHNNQRMYENTLKSLERLIKQFLEVKSACFAKIYHNAQLLYKLLFKLHDYQKLLSRIQRAYFAISDSDHREIKRSKSSIDYYSNSVARVIYGFVHSSHATMCQDRVPQKPRRRHRGTWIYQYRFCGCFKGRYAQWKSFNQRWAKFSKI